MTAKMYDNRLLKLDTLKAEKKEIEAQISKIESEIQAAMGDAETIETGRFILRYTFFNSSRFDQARFKAEQAALFAAYQKETEGRRFSYAAAR